jgi:hypothetical protein
MQDVRNIPTGKIYSQPRIALVALILCSGACEVASAATLCVSQQKVPWCATTIGVAMHNHGFAPSPAPGVNLNDNVIVGNHFSRNGADSADAATPGPVGINIYSVAPITGTVVSQNTFDNEAIDVAFKASTGQLSVHLNNFAKGEIGVDNLGTAPINATEDWWGCLTGPGGRRCAAASGPSITTFPWLISPFQSDSN